MSPPVGDGPHVLRRLTGGNTRVAERFRDRRVFLVGDAAHRTARPLLLDLTEDASAARELAPWRERVDIVVSTKPASPSMPAATALLLRPDSYVAWASGSPHPEPADLTNLRAAAQRWFGTPPSARSL